MVVIAILTRLNPSEMFCQSFLARISLAHTNISKKCDRECVCVREGKGRGIMMDHYLLSSSRRREANNPTIIRRSLIDGLL